MSPDFFTVLERQLVEAAERECAAPAPGRRQRAVARACVALDPPRVRALAPVLGALALVALIAGLAFSLGGEEQPRPAAPAVKLSGPTTPIPPLSPNVPPERRQATKPADAFDVYVLNGTSTNGMATEASKFLETAGFKVAGAGTAAVNTVRTSRVYSDDSAALTVARRLGISGRILPLTRDITVQAPGGNVVVLLGADYDAPPRRTRTFPFPAADGSTGTLTLTDGTRAQQLTLTVTGLPRGDKYWVWLETRDGQRAGMGYATWEDGVLRGAVQALTPEQRDPRRVYVTRLDGASARPSAGPVLADTGTLPGG